MPLVMVIDKEMLTLSDDADAANCYDINDGMITSAKTVWGMRLSNRSLSLRTLDLFGPLNVTNKIFGSNCNIHLACAPF